MFNLILDTSTDKGIILIAQEDKILFESHLFLKAVKGSALMLSVVQQGFNTLSISVKDLKCIACGVGPGSFTGIRVACSFAKGLAIGCEIPLIGFCSLLNFVTYEEGPFVSLIPTKMGGSYVLERLCSQGQIHELSEPTFLVNEKIKFNRIISPADTFPCARFLSKMVEKKFLEKKYSREGFLEMCYLNPSLW